MAKSLTKDRREYQLNIAFNRAEIGVVIERAEAAQLRLVDYGRLVLLRKSDTPIVVAPVAQVDRLTYEQLKRLGNNLNQLTRVANATGITPPGLEGLLADIRLVLNRGAMLGP